MNLFWGQQWRCRHREQICGHRVGKERWDEWREYHGNIYTAICKTASFRSQWLMELKLVLCDNLEGWDEVGVRTEVQEGGNISIFMVDSFDIWASLVAQMVKSLPAMWETWVWSLGWANPVEKEIPLQYSSLENPMARGPWQAMVHGVTKTRTPLCTDNNTLIYSRNQHNIVKQSSSN